jgi:trigger factor
MPATIPPLKVSTRPATRSTVVIEVDLPAERVRRSIEESLRHLGRRTRVPGFRPGKVPRPMLERALGVRRDDPTAPDPVYDDAKEHLFEASLIEALRESDLDVLSIAEPEWTSFEEGRGASYRVTLPVRPDVRLGAYDDFPFAIEVDAVDDARVDAVLDQLRDQQATLVPVEGRGAKEGDYAVVAFEGRRDGTPIEGAASERFPLVIGRERMIPGFEEQLLGMTEDEEKSFTLRFPDDYQEQELAGQSAEFTVTLRELREKSLPPLGDEFARSVGPYDDLGALRTELRRRLERTALDRARHRFADRIIEFATANATVELPDVLVDREVEVMLDELRVRLAEQRIGFDEYLRVTERDEAKLREESRPQAEHRVKVLLVLAAIADREGIAVDDAAVDAELARGREQSRDNPKLIAYLESDRGRSYIRSQLRRTRTVETLIDRWIDQHPEFADVRHLEDEAHSSPSPQAIPEGTRS